MNIPSLKVFSLPRDETEDVAYMIWTLNHVNDMIRLRMSNLSIFDKFKDTINWNAFVKGFPMSHTLIDHFSDYVDWADIAQYQRLSEEFIASHWINWTVVTDGIKNISLYQHLSPAFVQTNRTILDLTEYFSRQHPEWSMVELEPFLFACPEIWRQAHIPEQFINEHPSVDWRFIRRAPRRWSDAFIQKNFSNLNKSPFLRWAQLSESQIERFSDWRLISRYQVLSPEFILRHHHQVDWSLIAQFQNIGTELIPPLTPPIAIFKPERLIDLVEWTDLSRHPDLLESVAEDYAANIVWPLIAISNPSIKFLTDNMDRLSAVYITTNAPEEFLTANDRFITDNIRGNEQTFSMSFLDAHFDKFGAEAIVSRPLSNNFITTHWDRLDKEDLQMFQQLNLTNLRRLRAEGHLNLGALASTQFIPREFLVDITPTLTPFERHIIEVEQRYPRT